MVFIYPIDADQMTCSQENLVIPIVSSMLSSVPLEVAIYAIFMPKDDTKSDYFLDEDLEECLCTLTKTM